MPISKQQEKQQQEKGKKDLQDKATEGSRRAEEAEEAARKAKQLLQEKDDLQPCFHHVYHPQPHQRNRERIPEKTLMTKNTS